MIDGSPIDAGLRIKDNDFKTGTLRYEKLAYFSGGFHMTMESMEKRALLLDSVVRHFVSTYRTTKGRQDWVMSIFNPNQAEDELVPYVAALYRAAGDSVAQLAGMSAVSPLDVHQHMLDRARQYPLSMSILINLHPLSCILCCGTLSAQTRVISILLQSK